MKIDWDKVRTKALQITSKAAPATRVLERAVTMVARLQTVTPLGMVGVIAAGANAAHDHLKERVGGYGREFYPWVGTGLLIPALVAAGARVTKAKQLEGGAMYYEFAIAGQTFAVNGEGGLDYAPTTPEFATWLAQAIDAALPPAVKIVAPERLAAPTCEPLKLAPHDTEMGCWIAGQTRPFLADGPRTILLHGRPGVGKSTMAQSIARTLDLGRVVLVPNCLVGRDEDGNGNAEAPRARGSTSALPGLALLRPGVVIVDDIDKVRLQLAALEALREHAILTIFTANNAEDDTVMSADECRPGRVDEVYKITGARKERPAPFDQLDDETWTLVKGWPVAALNELAARIRHRGADREALRLDDLQERIARRTRSRGQLL